MITTRLTELDRFYQLAMLGIWTSGVCAIAGSTLAADVFLLVAAGAVVVRLGLTLAEKQLQLTPALIDLLTILYAALYPYDLFFGGIERSIHEHGALSFAALLQELRQQAAGEPNAASVIARIAGFHASGSNVDVARELALVLDGLRLRAVRDELDLMVEGGLSSPDAHQRFKLLNGELARLKNLLASQQNASN